MALIDIIEFYLLQYYRIRVKSYLGLLLEGVLYVLQGKIWEERT